LSQQHQTKQKTKQETLETKQETRMAARLARANPMSLARANPKRSGKHDVWHAELFIMLQLCNFAVGLKLARCGR
jgi:hypothetical protein